MEIKPKISGLIFGTLASLFLLSLAVFSFGPSVPAPGGNILAPISAISETQRKEGSLTVGGLLELEGGIIPSRYEEERPDCSSDNRGSIWSHYATIGEKDEVVVCVKGEDDTYDWVSMIGSFYLNTVVSGPGSLSINPVKDYYEYQEEVTITATPDEGIGDIIVTWEEFKKDSVAYNEEEVTIPMNNDKFIIASIIPKFPSLSTCGTEGRKGPSQGACDDEYGYGLVEIIGDGIQQWQVPEDGYYEITARGAQGDDIGFNVGNGAMMKGEFYLEKGDYLRVLVGQRGIVSSHAAGGGGTFVVKNVDSGGDEMFDEQEVIPLIIAGGGGSYERAEKLTDEELDGRTDECGGTYELEVERACNGEGGNKPIGSTGGAGGGYYTDGGFGQNNDGQSFLAGGLGGIAEDIGGFGGGGARNGSWGGGAGGGYSGGAAGLGGDEQYTWYAGGGSYISPEGTLTDSLSGENTGHGSVEIEYIGS